MEKTRLEIMANDLLNTYRVPEILKALGDGLMQRAADELYGGTEARAMRNKDAMVVYEAAAKAKIKDLCPGCNGISDEITKGVFKCRDCSGLWNHATEPMSRAAALRMVKLDEWFCDKHGAAIESPSTFYFDFTIQYANGENSRIHGWADTETKKVTQIG
jgi:hypothetical protein